MTPDHRILITKLAAELDHCQQLLLDDRRQRHPLADHARAALAEPDRPAVPEGRELKACVDWMRGSLTPSIPRQAADQLRCVELIDCLEKADWPHRYKVVFQQWMDIARAALAEADGPAVPEGREPASVATQPSEPEAEGPSDEALANFTAWFCRNYPGPDTLIHRPEWHAPKVFRAAADAIARWGRPAAAPMNNPYRAMCSELVEQVQRAINNHGLCLEASDALMHRARALLAEPDGPAVPDGREPASVAMQPTDEELDDWHSRCADLTRLGEAEHYWALDLQGDDVTAVARAALARWGHPAAAPVPEPGEVEGIAEWLNSRGRMADLGTRDWYFRAATLLQQQAAPVPVSERLPEPNTKVLAHYFNALGKGRTICAVWVPAKSRSDDADFADDDFTEYDEEDDKFYWPEGWYEAIENWDELGWVKVDEGEIAYWQPLPKWPANALPLPAGEVQP